MFGLSMPLRVVLSSQHQLVWELFYDTLYGKPFCAFTKFSLSFSTAIHHVFNTAIVTSFGGWSIPILDSLCASISLGG